MITVTAMKSAPPFAAGQVKAEQDQTEEIARHSLADMRYDAVSTDGV